METLAGFPFFAVEFTKEGKASPDRHRADAGGGGCTAATDLLVLVHGWNNDMAEARASNGDVRSLVRCRAAGA